MRNMVKQARAADAYNKRIVYEMYNDAESMTVIATRLRKLYGRRERRFGKFDRHFIAVTTKRYLDYARERWQSEGYVG